MIELDSNLKKALLLSLIINATLAFSGFYERTFDSYGHMFFADHYRNDWFNTWEPKWYAGFDVATYPPLAHQILGLCSLVFGLELSYVIISISLMILLPIGVFNFSKVFVEKEAAGYASILSVFFPAMFLSTYLWGQFTTLFSIVFLLFAIPKVLEFIKNGGLFNFLEALFLSEIVIASHHFTGIIFFPMLIIITLGVEFLKKQIDIQKFIKRTILFIGIGFLFSSIVLYPVLFSVNIQNVHVPHPTTSNYLLNLEYLNLFFFKMFGLFLILIPISYIVVRKKKGLVPLTILASFLLILGLGGTTPIPHVIFGENWLGFTYERFNIFSGICFMPLFGLSCCWINRKKEGKKILTLFLIATIVFSSWIGNTSLFLNHTNDVPVEQLADFLNRDEHWRWRYLTLGFGSFDFCKLSILTNATTIDGWYYRGRDIPELASSGVAFFNDAKFEKNGITVLCQILKNSSDYHLGIILCNDKVYEPLLNETGFIQLDEKYDEVTIWHKADSPTLKLNEIVNTNSNQDISDYIWGIIPIFCIFAYLCMRFIRVNKNKKIKLFTFIKL